MESLIIYWNEAASIYRISKEDNILFTTGDKDRLLKKLKQVLK